MSHGHKPIDQLLIVEMHGRRSARQQVKFDVGGLYSDLLAVGHP
jgi:hypothetical protein